MYWLGQGDSSGNRGDLSNGLDVCARSKEKMSRSVLKYMTLIKCEDDSVYQDMDECLEEDQV